MSEWYGTPVSEQETVIQISRNCEYANVYTTDTTMVTKLDKKYKRNREHTCEGKLSAIEYKVPKKHLQFRQPRILSEEQKKAASERMEQVRKKSSVIR